MIRWAACRSSFFSDFSAAPESSIVQAKTALHVVEAGDGFAARPNVFNNLGGKVIVFHVLDAALDHLADVIGFGPTGQVGQPIKPTLGFSIEFTDVAMMALLFE